MGDKTTTAPATATPEPLLTKFFMLVPTADDLTRWDYVGTQLARDRDHAARLFWPDRSEPFVFNAVSENAWRPRRRIPKVIQQATTVDVEMPDVDEVVSDRNVDGGAPTLYDREADEAADAEFAKAAEPAEVVGAAV